MLQHKPITTINADLASFHVLKIHANLTSDPLSESEIGRSDLITYDSNRDKHYGTLKHTSNAYSFSTVVTGVANFLSWLRAIEPWAWAWA
jgi:hypothetical protein